MRALCAEKRTTPHHSTHHSIPCRVTHTMHTQLVRHISHRVGNSEIGGHISHCVGNSEIGGHISHCVGNSEMLANKGLVFYFFPCLPCAPPFLWSLPRLPAGALPNLPRKGRFCARVRGERGAFAGS